MPPSAPGDIPIEPPTTLVSLSTLVKSVIAVSDNSVSEPNASGERLSPVEPRSWPPKPNKGTSSLSIIAFGSTVYDLI